MLFLCIGEGEWKGKKRFATISEFDCQGNDGQFGSGKFSPYHNIVKRRAASALQVLSVNIFLCQIHRIQIVVSIKAILRIMWTPVSKVTTLDVTAAIAK